MSAITAFPSAIFYTGAPNALPWTSQLESLFKCHHLTAEASVLPLANEIKPALIVISAAALNQVFLQKINGLRKQLPEFGLVYIAAAYSLEEELFCYNAGVDHYFLHNTPAELLISRILNLRHRVQRLRDNQVHTALPQKQVQEIKINIAGHDYRCSPHLFYLDNQHVQLPPAQIQLLHLFLSHPDQAFSRSDLLRLIWKNKKLSSRSIDAHVSKLRKMVPTLKDHITNVYGVGYVFLSTRDKASAA